MVKDKTLLHLYTFCILKAIFFCKLPMNGTTCVLLFLEQIRNARSTTEQTPKQKCVACFALEMSGEYRNEIIRGLSSMMLGN
jgi:hypothetical protein